MPKLRIAGAVLLVVTLGATGWSAAPAQAATMVVNGDAYAAVDANSAAIGNAVFERRWHEAVEGWISGIVDKRTANTWLAWKTMVTELTGGAVLRAPRPTEMSVARTSDGVELRQTFDLVPGVRLEIVARAVPGVAAVRMHSTVHSAAPLALPAYTLERLNPTYSLAPTTAAAIGFSGGADWRDEYDYRRDTTGESFDANAEWLETADGGLGLLMQRRNYLSSRMQWDGNEAAARVDLSHDSVYLGPFEEDRPAHPPPVPWRHRTVPAQGSLALEPVIVAFGTDPEDLHWQAHRMLMSDVRPYPRTINFNTDRVRGTVFEHPPRDGVGLPQFLELVPVAKRLGVETFVLDDGWQLYNGDWLAPDAERWPDGLEQARDILEADGMRLGLWMAPQSFHPSSQAWNDHREATCLPVGAGTAAYNIAAPDDGSNPAGIGIWDFNAVLLPDLIRYRDRLRNEIEYLTSTLRPAEFKFDFVVWLDCVFGSLYEQHDAFFDEIASLSAQFPGTGFGMDETNDFRGFPFESIRYGPTWFQNGNPSQDAVLHNVWSMAPYVPGFTIGQAVTIRPGDSAAVVDEKMASALAYHMTFWTDIRDLASETAITDRVRVWTDFAKQHRSLNGFAYPLLSDPLGRADWSGLQPWDADADEGYAMLYRLDSPDATKTVSFKGVRDATTYRLIDITPTASPAVLGDYDGATLRAGIPITIADAGGVRILRIEPI